jgi:hypothetical protein
MPAVFDKFGIRFQYPENWELDDDDSTSNRQSASVNSPGGGFFTVIRYGVDADPVELAQVALDAMRKEYDDLDSEAAKEEVCDVELIGFDVNFYCLDLINTAWIRAGRADSAIYLIMCQAEDREFYKVADVFRAMTISLLKR